MRVLMVGCGYVGIELCRQLKAAGVETFAASRNQTQKEYPHFRLDVLEPITFEKLPADFTHVVYLVSAVRHDRESYQAAYVDGLINTLSWVKRSLVSIRRIIFASSTAVYGVSDGSWVDESSPTEPTGFSGSVLLDAEQVVKSSGLEYSIVRFGGIYGPGRTRLVHQVLAQYLPRDDNPVYGNRIHRDDCAGAISHLLRLESILPLYLGVDSDPAPRQEVYQWLAKELGVKAELLSEMPDESRGNKRCSNRRLLQSGYRFRYPSFREGYRSLLG